MFRDELKEMLVQNGRLVKDFGQGQEDYNLFNYESILLFVELKSIRLLV
jgi:hypothetical protein